MIETLDLAGLSRVLFARDQGRPMSMITETVPEMRKGGRQDQAGRWPNPFWGRIIKRAKRNVWSGTAYDRHVNLQRQREGQPVDDGGDLILFESGRLWGGQCEYVNRFVRRHKTSRHLYLACRPPTVRNKPGGVYGITYRWQCNGRYIDPARVEPWLIEDRPSKRQGTARAIYWRTIDLSHLRYLTVDGVTYAVDIPPPQLLAAA